MHRSVWMSLLSQLPPQFQDRLMLVTKSGTEIAVQGILRIEGSFAMLKGRLAATTDTGRLFFVPYAQIDYISSQDEIKDAQFQELFGNVVFASEEDEAAWAPPAPPAPVVEAEETAVDHPVERSSAPTPTTPRPTAPIRSAVLERFRARTSPSSDALPRPAGMGG